MSPSEQLDLMNAIDYEKDKLIGDPSDMDAERYYYYIERGTDLSMIAPLPDNQFKHFHKLLSNKIKNDPKLNALIDELHTDIVNDYSYSMRKSIVDYVLMNLDERNRLKIEWTPKTFNLK